MSNSTECSDAYIAVDRSGTATYNPDITVVACSNKPKDSVLYSAIR